MFQERSLNGVKMVEDFLSDEEKDRLGGVALGVKTRGVKRGYHSTNALRIQARSFEGTKAGSPIEIRGETRDEACLKVDVGAWKRSNGVAEGLKGWS